ncbi:WD40 repeat-like protein, partial [Rhizoctonia solani]
MKDQLRMNICDLPSSFVPDDKVEDLQDQIKKNISPTLVHVCRNWGNHLRSAGPTSLSETRSRERRSEMIDDIYYRKAGWCFPVLDIKRKRAEEICSPFLVISLNIMRVLFTCTARLRAVLPNPTPERDVSARKNKNTRGNETTVAVPTP